MVVILHSDILLSYVQVKDMMQEGKFPLQVVSAYPVEKLNK